MKVAVLGCGPSGLFAAHAAYDLGHEVQIFSKKRKSFMRGAQYLHRPIEGLTNSPFKIDYRITGPIDGYRDKVYGETAEVQVSPETLVGIHDAWDIREAYDYAWDLYEDLIVDSGDIDLYKLADILDHGFDEVISTIPRSLLCDRHGFDHIFNAQSVWSTDYVKDIGEFAYEPKPDNLVVCSGNPEDWWYRQSRIHGWENTEFPYHAKPNDRKLEEEGVQSVWEVMKPISHNCTCLDGFVHVTPMGRYGAWEKGVLADSVYYDTKDLLS